MKHETREGWLNAAVELLRPRFKAHKKPIPKQVRVTCGWPSKSALAAKSRRIGECWSSEASGDKHVEIFISPYLSGARVVGKGDNAKDRGIVGVLDTLVHELVHAAVGLRCGHRGEFKRLALELGLEGPMKSCGAGAELEEDLLKIAKVLGPYPHAKLDKMTNGSKKQTTRLLKVECPGCGCLCRMSRKCVEEPGVPTCSCGARMVCQDLDPEETDIEELEVLDDE